MSIYNKIRKAIFGYDIFFSYSRKDSLDYAYALAQNFMKNGYECYIDQLSSIAPGKELPPNIKEAVKRSSAFVLIGSEGTQKSEPVRDEINLFLENNKNKPLIPITIDGAIGDGCIWYDRIRGLALIDESRKNLSGSTPAQDILDRIENALNFTKKSKRLRNAVIVTLFSVIAVVVGTTFYAQSKVQKALTEVADANDKVTSANKLAIQAEIKQKTAELKEKKVSQSLKQSEDELNRTLSQYQEEKKRVEAAKGELEKVERQKVRMEILANKNKALADEYDKVSYARNLAIEAMFENDDNPQLAALKALFALKQFEGKAKIDPLVEKTFRTVATLQAGIALRPFKSEIKHVCISPDMNFTAIADNRGELIVFNIHDRENIRIKFDLGESEPLSRLYFDSSGKYLVALTENDDPFKRQLTIFDMSEAESSKHFRQNFNCMNAEMNDDFNTLAVVDTTKTVSIIAFDKNLTLAPKQLFQIKSNEQVASIRFSNDNQKIAVGLSNALVELWDINDNENPIRTIYTNHRSSYDSVVLNIGTLRFTDDDKYLLTGTSRNSGDYQDDTLKLWYLDDTLAQPKRYYNQYGPFDSFISGNILSSINVDGIIYNWDINSGIPFSIDSVGVYGIGEDNISAGRYLSNGENILLSNEGGEVFLLQKDEGHFPQKRRFFYSPTPVNAFDLSSDGSFIISGDDEGVVKIFQTDQNKNSALIKLNGFGTKIHDIRESTDNNRLLIEGDQNINIWDIHNPEQPHLLYRNIRDSSFFGYEISPNGKWAIVKDSLNNLGGIYDLETKELNFSKYDLSRYSGKFSPSSNYFIQEKDSFFLLHDLERSKTKFLFRSGSEDYFALSNDDSWMISKSEHNEEIDSVRLWFLNGKADTLMKETKKLSKKFSTLQLVSGSQLLGLSKGNLIDSVFLFTLQKDGTIREEASEMLDNANSVSVSEQGNYLLTYNSELPQDDNSYYVTFPELWTIKNNSLSTKSFLFTGTTPIREAKFSHSGKWLITIGGEESIVEIWRLDADTLKLVLKPTGPFSGFENIWDFEFSPNDNCVVFYSTFFGNTPYVVKLDEFPINPVGVALKNDGQGTRGLAFSPNSEYLYVYNLNRPGLSSIIKNGKFSVNVFDLTHPESRPSELYRSSVGQAYSSQLPTRRRAKRL